MTAMKTPGVYIVEKSAFPNSVVEAPTSIPAFIGITEMAQNGADSLQGTPWKITSMTEYNKYFGGAPIPQFTLSVASLAASPVAPAGDDEAVEGDDPAAPTSPANVICSFMSPDKSAELRVARPATLFTLYYNLVMFFANGGGTCYIVSVGNYDEGAQIDKSKVGSALAALEKEQEITMVLAPEAVLTKDCKDIQQSIIMHCGKMMNRFAIFDVQPKAKENETMDAQVETFQTNIGANFLSYGAVYYPYLNTSVLSDRDIDGSVLTWDYASPPDLKPFFAADSKLPSYVASCFGEVTAAASGSSDAVLAKSNIHNALMQNWPEYKLLAAKVKDLLNILPPSAAMAGIYTMVDNTRGVWKAPANVSLNFVNSPSETIDNASQENLNMPMNGKAVNAIRTFIGEGIKVWGARTLDGNSQDWRYINVRRTMLYLEESVKNASKAYVFEPNVSNTWVSIKSMIDNFLRSVWKRGGLAGSTPEEAFEVHVGLGDTMTANDILDGVMHITVLVAITRPAEFIEITFQQQMQKS